MKLRSKLSLISLSSVLLITLPGLFFLYHLAKKSYLNQTFIDLQLGAQVNSNAPVELLRRAETGLETLAKELKLSLSQPPLTLEIAEFDALVSKDEFGVTRSNPMLFDGTRQAGVFIPADVDLTDDVKRTKLRAMKLLSGYGQAALQFFDGVWFDQANKTSVIFWRRDADFIYKLAPDHDYTLTLWNTLASPELNPERVAKWTPAILESPVGTWVVSCVYPVDVEGEWFGVLGHDIALTQLIDAFRQQDTHQNSQHFLLDAYGNYILAGQWQAELENTVGEFKPDLRNEPLLQALLQKKTYSSEFQTVYLQGSEYLAIAVPISGLEWKYVYLVSIDEVMAPMKIIFFQAAGLILLIGLLTAILMHETIRVTLVKPLLAFSNMLHIYGHGQIDTRLSHRSNDELGEMASTINTMADNIAQQQFDLKKSNDRYQYVVNAINEVIFKLDDNGRIQFINDAWFALSNIDPGASINLYLSSFFHPDSLLEFDHAIENTLSDPSISYLGELKLRNTNNQTIWVELNMQSSTEIDDKTGENNRVITGNMANVSERKYLEIVDKIISSSEKEAVDGRTIDQILSLFCYQAAEKLSLNLVWVVRIDTDTSHVIAAAGTDIHSLKNYDSSFFQSSSLSSLQKIASTGQSKIITTKSDNYDCLVVPLSIPEQDTALVFLHSQHDTRFSTMDCKRLEGLIKKIASTLQLAQDHKWMLLHRIAIESTGSAIVITDRLGNIEWCNNAFSQLTGYQLNEIKGQTPKILNDSRQSSALYQQKLQRLSTQKIWRGESINKRKDGSHYTAVETITPLLDKLDATTHFITVQEDISDLKAAEARTRFLATHDYLTELPNRYLFQERLQHAINTSERNAQQHAVLFMDLDGFKLVNDTVGHQKGDIILQQVAERLSNIIRQSDTVARIGGDEFVILVESISDISDVTVLSNKILDSFEQPFDINGIQLRLTTSIGIAIYPNDNDNVEDLIRSADAAMYHAKAQGRNNYQSFTSEINKMIESQLILERDLRTAIKQKQFELHYQPQINSTTNRVIGMEALVRWNHPDKGQVPPSDFIPFAEDSGLIVELGKWVLQAACQQAHEWHQAGYRQLKVSINVSVRQLIHSEFVSSVAEVIQQTQVDPELIMIEITESVMVNQPDVAVTVLTALKQLGVSLSIDDFGTGYSSLQYLRLMPLDELKIDRSFIRDVHHKEGMAIIESICALGRSMKLSLIAEGVEDADTPALLASLGCYHIQGYLYSKPLTVADANVFLKKQPGEKSPSKD